MLGGYARLPGPEKRWQLFSIIVILCVALGCDWLRGAWWRSQVQPDFRDAAVERMAAGPVDLFFVGSSHIYTGINPDCFSCGVVNLADSGMNYQLAESLCDKYWSSVGKAKAVVIELDAVPVYQDTVKLHDGDYRNFWHWKLTGMDLPADDWTRCKAQVAYLCNAARYDPIRPWMMASHSDRSGEDAASGPGFHARSDHLNRADNEAFFAALGTDFDERIVNANIAALQRLVQRLRSNRIAVFFLRPPFHQDYWDHPSSHRRAAYCQQAYAALAATDQASDQQIIDLRRMPELSDNDYSDLTHLSISGANQVSAQLDVLIRQRCAKLGQAVACARRAL